MGETAPRDEGVETNRTRAEVVRVDRNAEGVVNA
jgi:hypothetical protein